MNTTSSDSFTTFSHKKRNTSAGDLNFKQVSSSCLTWALLLWFNQDEYNSKRRALARLGPSLGGWILLVFHPPCQKITMILSSFNYTITFAAVSHYPCPTSCYTLFKGDQTRNYGQRGCINTIIITMTKAYIIDKDQCDDVCTTLRAIWVQQRLFLAPYFKSHHKWHWPNENYPPETIHIILYRFM